MRSWNDLDVAVQHRRIRANAQPVRNAVHLDPVFGVELLLGDGRAHALAEHLGAAAGQRVEPGIAKRDEHIVIGHLLDARDVRDLDRGERLDVHIGVALLQSAEHLGVVLEPCAHVEPAHDVELAHVRIRGGLRVHLIHRVAIRPGFLGQPRVRAEDARLAKDADVGRIDVLVRGEVHDLPCFASFAAFARCPTPSRSGVSKSVRPSAALSRVPDATFAPIARSAGSLSARRRRSRERACQPT